tara:strand:+ start:23525 stop:24190 length:666 start_codon:yes stop_codon:yes gene_type:complete
MEVDMLIRNVISIIFGKGLQLDHQRLHDPDENRLEVERRREARRKAVEKRSEWQRKQTAAHNWEYEAHVQAVDLTGMAERSGYPLNHSEIEEEVKKRFELADRVQRDPQLNLSFSLSDPLITKILDRANRHYLSDHEDFERQRKTAKVVMDARADLDPIPPIREYVTAVANFVARSRCSGEFEGEALHAVTVRAILMRSTDPKWARIYKGALQPLSERPFR